MQNRHFVPLGEENSAVRFIQCNPVIAVDLMSQATFAEFESFSKSHGYDSAHECIPHNPYMALSHLSKPLVEKNLDFYPLLKTREQELEAAKLKGYLGFHGFPQIAIPQGSPYSLIRFIQEKPGVVLDMMTPELYRDVHLEMQNSKYRAYQIGDFIADNPNKVLRNFLDLDLVKKYAKKYPILEDAVIILETKAQRVPCPETLTQQNFDSRLEHFLSAILQEVRRARSLFPSPDGSMVALTEEVGELAKALLDEPWPNVMTEAKQVAAMAIRVALEGDPTLLELRQKREAKRNNAKK